MFRKYPALGVMFYDFGLYICNRCRVFPFKEISSSQLRDALTFENLTESRITGKVPDNVRDRSLTSLRNGITAVSPNLNHGNRGYILKYYYGQYREEPSSKRYASDRSRYFSSASRSEIRSREKYTVPCEP